VYIVLLVSVQARFHPLPLISLRQFSAAGTIARPSKRAVFLGSNILRKGEQKVKVSERAKNL
jgi:hypothetical protein